MQPLLGLIFFRGTGGGGVEGGTGKWGGGAEM